jgi:hypothetical protein
MADGLGVDLALVPLLDRREIGAAGLPVLAALPAVSGEEVGGRGQHVGGAAQEIAAAVAVEIDRELDVGRRHELGLADFARPCAAQILWRDIAALDDA